MRATVIGLGYVGLVTATGLAEWGHQVTGVEASDSRLRSLRIGRLPFFEPGLAELVTANVRAGRLGFVPVDRADAIGEADVVITAVGTHDGNGGWQTATMQACLSQVVPQMADGAVLVVRSTLPPEYVRTLGEIANGLRREVGRPAIPVLLNPEFTQEGRAVSDFMEPDRIVMGVISDPDGRGQARLAELYEKALAPMLVMDGVDACLSKLGANLFLATKISFANELAHLCETFGADVVEVVRALSHDSRIGGKFLRAGVGFGGSCLPHQVAMTVHTAELAGLDVPVLRAVHQVNARQRALFVERLTQAVGGSLDGRRIALLGLTFKPDTDDLRDAPSLTIARSLLEAGATVVAYDPMLAAAERAASLVPGLVIADTALAALEGADAAGLVTEWREFADLDWPTARSVMRRPVVVDGRNALEPRELGAAGFTYIGFGRGLVPQVPPQTMRPSAATDGVAITASAASH